MKCEVALEAAPGLFSCARFVTNSTGPNTQNMQPQKGLLNKTSSKIEKAGGDLERGRIELEQAKASRLTTESKVSFFPFQTMLLWQDTANCSLAK